MLFSYYSRSQKRSSAIRAKGRWSSKVRAPVPLWLEHLEDRLAPAVNDITPGHTGTFATIQAAVNFANPGDTILADAGTYAEKVTINKSLILEGAQHGTDARNRTGAESIVTGTGDSGFTPFNVTASNVTIDGFTVEDATSANVFGFGIVEGAGTSGTQIVNNIIQDNIVGLSLANNSAANAGLIQHNLFQNNNQAGPVSGTGIYTDQFNAGGTVTSVVIDSNTFTGQIDAGLDFSSTDATKPATDITISNNVFDANGRGLVAFNLTSSTVSHNTFSNSTSSLTADIRLFEGVNGLNITGNLLENGAGSAVRIGNDSTGSPNATNIQFSLNSISGYTGPAGVFQVDNYTGTLNAMSNWWGAISGPTIASNLGGLGQTLVDPNNQVTYRTWLIYGTDADTIAAGFQLPTTINVTEGGDISPADNDYTRLANAIGSVQSGQTLILSGTFDWTKTFAAAAWAKGNDGIAGTADDYTIYGPANVNNVTLTAASLGAATIQGPGSITNLYLEGPLQLDTGNFEDRTYGSSTNQNWTISNLNIFDFATGIVMFDNPGGNSSAFSGTHIINNHIRVAPDVLDTVTPANTTQNIGIYYSFGQNQVIQNNTIDLQGDGVSDSANNNFSSEVAMQGDTGGGNVYNGFLIDSNTVNVLHAQSSNPEKIRGIWENTDGTTSNITVSNNKFLNLAAGNNPALNIQIAYRLTSPSSATTTILYENNQAAGANVGFQYYPGYVNTGTPPVQLIGNTLTNVFNGFDFSNAMTVNYLSGNSATGTGSAGTGVAVGASSTLTTDGVHGTNIISGFATGVDVNGGSASLQQNTISADSIGVSVENSGVLTSVTQNFITGATGDGIHIASTAGAIAAITNNDLSGDGGKAVNDGLSTLEDASLNWWGGNTRAAVQAAISGTVDYTPFFDSGIDTQPATPGFQGDFSTLDVDIQSPEVGAIGRIQEGVNDVLIGGTVNVLSGTYVENVTITKNMTLAGVPGSPPSAIIHPVTGNGVAVGVPVTNVTIKNLEVTGAVNGVNVFGVGTVTLQNLKLDSDSTGLTASTLTILNLSDLTLTGNTTAGGTISNVTAINYTPLSGSTGASSTITGSSFQRGSDQAVHYSGVPTLNVFGSDGSDTFNVMPSATTTFTVNGGLPDPPALPGDTLNVTLAGTTNPTLTDTFSPATGFSGSWTFGNANPVNFTGMETLLPMPPTITSSDTATFTAGQANTFQVTTLGAPPATLTEAGALPGGVTFTDNGNGTATLAGTPNAGTGGTFTFTITASNGVVPGTMQNFTLTVNEAPTITSTNTATFLVGQASTFTVTTGHDFPAATTLTETGALPGGVTFTDNHNGTATLTGMPNAGTGGTFAITVTASNGVTPMAMQTFTLKVNEAPTITSANTATFLVGQASTFSVTTGHDFPTASLTETGALPGGVTFTDNGNGAATLAGTPKAGTGGIFTFTITASNGVTPDATQTFTLTVNEAPSITSGNAATFLVGQASTFTVTTGHDFPTATTLSETGALPGGVTFTDNHNGTATLAGTPKAGTGGAFSFTITASNGVTPAATQTFTLTVYEAPSITSANAATFLVGQASTFSVTTGHDFPTATLKETGALPGGVSFTDNGNGTATLAGMPNTGTDGAFTFTITASNGVTPDATQTFTLTVNEAPSITSGNAATFLVGQASTFSVTTGHDFPTATLKETGALPGGVTFTDNGNGTATLAGTPNTGTNGIFTFTITASNGVTPDASQAFTLTVNSPIDELGAYRASNGSWSLDSDSTPGFNSATDQVFFSFSPPHVTGVAGDWTGTGHTNIGDFSNGTWHLDLNGNGVLDSGETFQFGQAGDQPVVGDWTGNGVTNIGVFRTAPDGISGEFILDTNGDHVMDAGDETFTFGLGTDRIVIGDWNGAGKDEVGVFRDAASFNPADAGDAVFSLDTNGDHQFDAGDQVFVFGLITDGLIVGDWNGAGKSEVGVYRDGSTAPVGSSLYAPGTALFSLDTNGDHQFDAGDQVFLYGLSSDQFVSGHWAKTPPLQAVGTPQAQFAANGPGSGGSALTEAQLEPVFDQAIATWAADGANVTQLEAAQVQIGTLDDNLVGETNGNQITLDATADGWGWNTDSSNADFTTSGVNGLQATPGSAAFGKMDLLTVVEHELGHELGLADVDPLTNPSNLMAATLAVGVRRQPTTQAVDAVFASMSGPRP